MPIERLTSIAPLPARDPAGHKGTFGRVLIVGGQLTMIGAPCFSALAALRTGSGLVQLATPRSILAAALTIVPEAVGLALGHDHHPLLQAASAADAVVIGPGMGQSPDASARLLKLLALDKPAVIDADALNLLARRRNWPDMRLRAVLTPHPGEMRRLAKFLKQDDVPDDIQGRLDIATRAALHFNQVIVLKGHQTIVCDGRRAYVNNTGNTALAKGGSGDILSGIIGSLLGQKMSGMDAAVLGVWLHGTLGELAAQHWNCRAVLARNLLDAMDHQLWDAADNASRTQ